MLPVYLNLKEEAECGPDELHLTDCLEHFTRCSERDKG
jgi:hypothetical protein